MTIRQIILDTETTGLSPEQGHRLIEIGCVELVDRRLTNNNFHCYINPERAVDEGAFKVHGLSAEFLADKPIFAHIKDDFLDFIAGAELIIHNAPFDVGFINAEFKRIDNKFQLEKLCNITDTLVLAKKQHPGQRNSLDALCKRYFIDATDRILHGALLDAQLLADVYIAMTSGQKKMDFVSCGGEQEKYSLHLSSGSPVRLASVEELQEHHAFLEKIKNKAGKLVWEI
jgi:DNA polymerase-3 subunit epsilon